MKRFINYLKNSKGRGFIPVSIFTLLLSGFVGYALFSFFGFYVQAMGGKLPDPSVILKQFIAPVTLCFFVTLWLSFIFQTFWAFLFGKICRFKFNKGTTWRVSMTTMILFWALSIASMFTSLGVKLWIVLDYLSKSALNLLGNVIISTPYLLIPVIVIIFAAIWSLVPALLGMIALIFLRNKDEKGTEKVLPKKETKKKKG